MIVQYTLVTGIILSLFLLLAAYISRGGRRITLKISGLLILTPCAVALSIQLYSRGEDISSELGILSIVISFIFGVAGSKLSINGLSRPNVGLVIASKTPFQEEIRKAIRATIAPVTGDVVDHGGEQGAPKQDLHAFSAILTRTLQQRVDYLIVWPPSVEAAKSEEMRAAVGKLKRRGGLCIFLENGPDYPTGKKLDYAHVRHNADRATTLLVEAIRDLQSRYSGKILNLLGPEYSEPAQKRNQIYAKKFSGDNSVESLQLTDWSSDDAVEYLCERESKLEGYDIIVCPNDSIALALVDAISVRPELSGLKKTRVVGFDGLPRARACIAENSTPFQLTYAIPPTDYGIIAGRIIVKLARPNFCFRNNLRKECRILEIPADYHNILHPRRARASLYEE